MSLTLKNLDELRGAVTLAQLLVSKEIHLAEVERCNAPEIIVSIANEDVTRFNDKVAKNSLAAEFLPQARKIIGMQEEMNRYLATRTFLGKLDSQIDEYCMENRLESIDVDFASGEEMLAHFMDTVAKGDTKKIVSELQTILSHAILDIKMRDDFPPFPPRYQLSASMSARLKLLNLIFDPDEEDENEVDNSAIQED